MAKYRLKNTIVEAEVYQKGMEDGFAFYDLQGKYICYMSKEDVKTKPYPRASRFPVIVNQNTGAMTINDGDYIVTMHNGDRFPVDPESIKRMFTKVEE